MLATNNLYAVFATKGIYKGDLLGIYCCDDSLDALDEYIQESLLANSLDEYLECEIMKTDEYKIKHGNLTDDEREELESTIMDRFWVKPIDERKI